MGEEQVEAASTPMKPEISSTKRPLKTRDFSNRDLSRYASSCVTEQSRHVRGPTGFLQAQVLKETQQLRLIETIGTSY